MTTYSVHSDTRGHVSLTSTISSLSNSSWPWSQRNVTIPAGCLVPAVSSLGFIPWDNADNLVSQATEQLVNRTVTAICLPLLFVLSLPCNLLNILVFCKQGLRERVNLCLFALSLVDFLHMLNSFLYIVESIRFPFTLMNEFGPLVEFILENSLVGLVRGFSWVSGFISMLIACERCLCVVSPLRSQTFLKTKTTAIIIVIATVVILAGVVTTALRWSLVCVFNPATNTTSKALSSSKFYKENKAHLDVLAFLVATLQRIFYVIVVSAMTIVTSVKLKKMMSWREKSSSMTLSPREIALTRMLIAVSVLYVVCSMPTVIIGVSVVLVPDVDFSGRYHNFLKLLTHLMDLGSAINSTFNFFVYILMGSRFKETLRGLLCCHCAVKASSS